MISTVCDIIESNDLKNVSVVHRFHQPKSLNNFIMMQPPKTSMTSVFSKISPSSKQKPLRVMVLGLAGIGKTGKKLF